jgi:hypothetical protein
MPAMRHSTHRVTLEVPYERAFDYLADWRTQPEWATNFVKGIRQEGEQVLMTTPFGEMPIERRTNAELGTINIVFPGGHLLPTRLTAMGEGSLVYTFTFSMPAEAPEETFREGQRGMEEELQTLRQILER